MKVGIIMMRFNKYLLTHHNLEHVKHPTLQSSEERIHFFLVMLLSLNELLVSTYKSNNRNNTTLL